MNSTLVRRDQFTITPEGIIISLPTLPLRLIRAKRIRGSRARGNYATNTLMAMALTPMKCND